MTHAKEPDTTQDNVTVTTREERTWSPGQVVSGVIGLLLTVMGGVALARLLPTDSLTGGAVEVFGVSHTVLMGVIAIGVGVLFLFDAASPFLAKRGTISLGVVTLAFGLIVIIEPAAFENALGIGRTGGWLYAVIGLVSVVTGFLAPVYISRR